MEKEQLTILLVTGSTDERRRLTAHLSRSELAARLRHASHTEQALRKMHRKELDLMLVHHDLPGVNVFSLLQHARRLERGLPVVVVAEDALLAREVLQRGADDYLTFAELEAVSFLHLIGNILEKKRLRAEVEAAQEQIRELALRDGLTQLYNQRHFFELLEREFSRARRYHRPLAVLMADIDHFKTINDHYGHRQGDELIRRVAELLRGSCRQTDLVSRYGGDEFVLILPETTLAPAFQLGERILANVQQSPLVRDGKVIPLSLSMGVAAVGPETRSKEELLQRADQALYAAKHRGRGCVVASEAVGENANQDMQVPSRRAAARHHLK